MTSTLEPEVGKARRRKEDARLITGRTRWTDNITLPGMLHLAILRSPMAHARIVRIDTSRARELPGIVAVYTASDLDPAAAIALPCAWPITPDMKHPRRPVLAADTVHFAGEGVAIVVARDAYLAQDALEAIDVDYEDLPVVLDMEAALADGAPLVHPELETNRNALWVFDSAEAGTGGDVAGPSTRPPAPTTGSYSPAGSASSGWSRRSWNHGPLWSTRPHRRSRSGRRPRSRTSSGRWPRSPLACPSTSCG